MEAASFAGQLIDIYSMVVLVAVVMSWFQLHPDHPAMRVLSVLTEPVLAPIRKLIPPAGGLDFSPMILLILLRIVRGML